MKMLVFLSSMLNLVTKSYKKSVTLCSFFKILKKIKKLNVKYFFFKLMLKIHKMKKE